MIQRIITLLVHDLGVAAKNKTLFLVVCVPLFIYLTLTLVDPASPPVAPVKLALLTGGAYPPEVHDALIGAVDVVAIHWADDENTARHMLHQHDVSGLLRVNDEDASRLTLTVIQQTSVETLTLVQRVEALQDVAEHHAPSWIARLDSIQSGSIKLQTLSIWILMMSLLVGFVVMPAQVAEEKEKQLLLGWLQTPVRESEWLASKLLYGMVLTLLSVAVLQGLSGWRGSMNGPGYLALLCAGALCFGALGTCLGLLCRNAATARTLGILCYLPLLLPAALGDMSDSLRQLAPCIISYPFHESIRSLLLEDAARHTGLYSGVKLVVVGLLACLVSHRLIARRWLMS